MDVCNILAMRNEFFVKIASFDSSIVCHYHSCGYSNCHHFISISDIVTKVGPYCSVLIATLNEADLPLLVWLTTESVYLSMLVKHGVTNLEQGLLDAVLLWDRSHITFVAVFGHIREMRHFLFHPFDKE